MTHHLEQGTMHCMKLKVKSYSNVICVKNLTQHKSVFYDCSKCGSTLKGKQSFKQHLKSHTTSIKCSECDLVFNSPDYLRKHKYNMHNVKRERIPCNECDS